MKSPMKGTVFVVWGGNCKLARAVEKELNNENFKALVGGSDDDPSKATYYMGPKVIRQMRSTTRAVILAQWPPEKPINSNCSIQKIEFRANLMFEWGYLLRHLPDSYIHVFLIGIKRDQIPSDLHGSHCTEIEFSKKHAAVAKNIKSEFLKHFQQIQIDPIDAYENWEKWKNNILKIVENEESKDNIRLAAALLHSIQPAYYSDEIDYLRDICKIVAHESLPELRRAIQVVLGACDYYDGTKVQDTPSVGMLRTILDSIHAKPIILDDIQGNPLAAWTELKANNFSGLCFRRMSEVCEAFDKEAYLNDSIDCFTRALNILDNVLANHGNEIMLKLWEGYICRNLGRVYAEIGDEVHSQKMLHRAKEARSHCNSELRSRCDIRVYIQLVLDSCLISIDLAKYGHEIDPRPINEIVDVLETHKATHQSILWRKTLSQLKSYAKQSGNTKISKKLKKYMQ